VVQVVVVLVQVMETVEQVVQTQAAVVLGAGKDLVLVVPVDLV
jgi:hypothetical protein